MLSEKQTKLTFSASDLHEMHQQSGFQNLNLGTTCTFIDMIHGQFTVQNGEWMLLEIPHNDDLWGY